MINFCQNKWEVYLNPILQHWIEEISTEFPFQIVWVRYNQLLEMMQPDREHFVSDTAQT